MPVLIFSFMRAPEREDTSVCPRKYDNLETYWFMLRKQVCVKICGATFPLCSDKISCVYTWTLQRDMEHDCPTVGVLSSSLAPFWFSHQPSCLMSHPAHTPTHTYTNKHVHTSQMEPPGLSPCSVCPGSKAKRHSQLLSILTMCWSAFRPLPWRSLCANLLYEAFHVLALIFLYILSLPLSFSQMGLRPSPCAGPVCWLLASQHPALLLPETAILAVMLSASLLL